MPRVVAVLTDHQTLTYLMAQEVLSRVQSHWISLRFLQFIKPLIQSTLGKANVVTNALSLSRGHGPANWDASQQPEQD